jgi:hypothetical protein
MQIEEIEMTREDWLSIRQEALAEVQRNRAGRA